MTDRPRPEEEEALDSPQPENERRGILDPLTEGDVGGALRSAGEMFLPDVGTPGSRSIGDAMRQFVEFTTFGDIGDIGAAIDPDSGLDPLERLLAATPILGGGALGARGAYRKLSNRRQQAMGTRETAYSMAPPPREAYDFDADFETTGGAEALGDPRQTRRQAAQFEQLAFESKSPFAKAALRAESWDELAAATSEQPRKITPKLRGIGSAVIAQVDDPTLYGNNVDTQQFVAAKVALTKWKRAVDLGLLESEAAAEFDRELIFSESSVDNAVKIAQLEAATSGILGPDLNMSTPGRLGQIWIDDGGVRMAYGIVDELLPNRRLFSEETQYPLDPEGVRKGQQAIDFDVWKGNAAVALAKAYTESPDAVVDSGRWYRNFNNSAQALAEDTGYSVHQTAGVISALSANTPWLPDNLIGAVHVVLQTGRPDLVPGSPEYRAAFKRATIDAGWKWDMFDDSSSPLREQYGPTAETGFEPDFEGLMDHYADPQNVTSPQGNMIGMADATKKGKVDLILKANLPPWLALRGMKTNSFGRLGAEPTLTELVTVDVWQDRGFFGTRFVNRPLAHEGYEGSQIEPDQTYYDPLSDEQVSGSEILERLDSMAKEHGWTKKQAEAWRTTLAQFPTKQAQARYFAQAEAHLLVRDVMNEEFGHAVQAPSWATFRDRWEGLGPAAEAVKDDPQQLRAVAQQGHLTTSLFQHLEGNPPMERTAPGMVWNVDSTISGTEPKVHELDSARKGTKRDASGGVHASVIAVRNPDGTVTPYADRSTEGVPEVLRHATPTGIVIGKNLNLERHVANRARPVTSSIDHLTDATQYVREDGRRAAGHTVLKRPDGQPHPGTQPGNRVVALVPKDRAADVDNVRNRNHPFDFHTVDVETRNTGTSRNKIAASDIRDLSPDKLGHVFQRNDWFAISAWTEGNSELSNKDRNRQLETEIRKRGGEVLYTKGRYGGVEETGFLVTGLSYRDAFDLGQMFDQESVATPFGLVYMDGTYQPAQGKPQFGEGVNQLDHTEITDTGHKFVFDYDSQHQPLPEDIDAIADVQPDAEPMTQVTIDMGGDYGYTGQNWEATEKLLRELEEIPGARIRLHTHARNRVPAWYSKAVESVVEDQAGNTGSILHRAGDQYARHQADVWIPDWEWNTLSDDGFGGERARRGSADARSIMEIDQEAGMVWFDRDVAVQVNPEDNVTMSETGSVFQGLRVNGNLVREMVVDTNGPVPILDATAQDVIPAPGRTVVELSRGSVTSIRPHSDADWADARDAVASVGLIPDGENVTVEYPETGEMDVEPTTLRFEAEKGTPKAKAHASIPTLPEDMDTTKRVQRTVPEFKKVRLGRNAHPDLHRQVAETLEGLHGDTGKFPGTRVVGAIPNSIWEGRWGIETMFETKQKDFDALTNDGIILNERPIVERWNRGAQIPTKKGFLVRSENFTDFEVTLTHEIGHLVHRHLDPDTLKQHVDAAKQELGGPVGVRSSLSKYARRNDREFAAEAFAKVMVEGDKAPAPLIRFVQGVMDTAT